MFVETLLAWNKGLWDNAKEKHGSGLKLVWAGSWLKNKKLQTTNIYSVKKKNDSEYRIKISNDGVKYQNE